MQFPFAFTLRKATCWYIKGKVCPSPPGGLRSGREHTHLYEEWTLLLNYRIDLVAARRSRKIRQTPVEEWQKDFFVIPSTVFWEKDTTEAAQIRTQEIQGKFSQHSMETCPLSHVDCPTEHRLWKFPPNTNSQLIRNVFGASLFVFPISSHPRADGRRYSLHHHYLGSINKLTPHPNMERIRWICYRHFCNRCASR